MRMFTKEITALLATAAVSTSIGAASAASNENVTANNMAVNVNLDNPAYNVTTAVGTYMTTTSTTTQKTETTYLTTTAPACIGTYVATAESTTTTTLPSTAPYYDDAEVISTIGTSIASTTSTTTTEEYIPSYVGTTIYREEIPAYEGTFTMSYPATETTGTEVISDEEIVAGDANCDSQVSLADSILIMQYLANGDKYGENGTDETHMTAKGRINADVSESGNGLTNKDALAVQKYMLKIIPTLPES
jgi:hypothetical protein